MTNTTVQPHRLLKFDLIARCAILQQALVTCVLAWFVPVSLTSKLIAEGNQYGHFVLIALTAVIAVGIADIFVNDVLPAKFTLQWCRQRRHKIYNFIAGLYFIQAFAGVGDTLNAEDILCFAYFLEGGIAAWYSWTVSVRAEHV